MANIPGDGRTFGHHLLTANFKEIFGHDIPKALHNEQELVQSTWDKLSPELKAALTKGSGIFKVIADDVNAVPKSVYDIIQQKLGISLEDASKWLADAQETVTGFAADTTSDPYATIAAYQDYFKKYEGTKLGAVLSGAAQIVSLVINPGSTVAEIVMNIETAYQVVKKLFSK